PHDSQTCSFIMDDQSSSEQVNYVGNQPRPPQNNPYSNTYNPGRRNHPNFSWGGNQGQRTNNNFNNQNWPYQPPFQRQQPYQPPAMPVQPPQKQSQPSSLEAALEKLTLSTTAFMEETRSNFKNQGA
ncbi:hypothetical protein PIB30_114319, partial [Stylosanthes scabra]|nr:hypothetical protein [Stylosanthes scabra]